MAETKALALPDTKEIDKKAMTVLETSRAITIQNNKQYVIAGDFLRDLKAIEREIDETFDPAIKAAYDAHKAVLAAKGKHSKPIEEAEKIIKDKMIGYQEEQEKKRAEDEENLRKLAHQQEEADRNFRAEKLIEEGKPEEALAVLGRELELSPVILPSSAPKMKGIVMREQIKAEVYDLLLLVKAVAEGKIPLTLVEPNMKAINGMIRAAGGDFKLPGVRVVTEKIMATGAMD